MANQVLAGGHYRLEVVVMHWVGLMGVVVTWILFAALVALVFVGEEM